MSNDDERDIKQMWQQQPRERQMMTIEEVRRRATDFDKKVEQWKLVGGVTFALLLVKNAWEVWVDTDVVERAGDSLMLLALLFVVYRFWRHVRAEIAPSTLGVANCVEHYRSRLRRQRDLSRDGWKFILPFAPGVGLILFGRALEGRPPLQVMSLIVLALAMFVGTLWVIARGARKLEREIAALD
jgi:hypothetical protein